MSLTDDSSEAGKAIRLTVNIPPSTEDLHQVTALDRVTTTEAHRRLVRWGYTRVHVQLGVGHPPTLSLARDRAVPQVRGGT
ncbi:hypothetical protein ADL03_15370 [Nocardia sp. NRRL S-836]|nr:hypothetical protein ADL03_15370 [Nocardia sp. NRRL S-836]